MNDKNDVKRREKPAPDEARESAMTTADAERAYVPEVDICEDADCIRLVASMPGVGQDAVDVSVERNVLTIEGRARVEGPEGYELVGQEFEVGKYRRDFTLPAEVNVAGIKARVHHGVLELTIPKREELKTRKIEIEA